jgi:hypothetical protein
MRKKWAYAFAVIFLLGLRVLALDTDTGTLVIRRVASALYDGITDTTLITLNAAIDTSTTAGSIFLVAPMSAEQAIINANVAANYHQPPLHHIVMPGNHLVHGRRHNNANPPATLLIPI